MLTKSLCIVFLATLTVSLAYKEDDLVHTVLTSGSNIIKEVAKVTSNDPDKYSVDLNDLYKKYEVQEKADQAKNFLLTQFQRGIESSKDYYKQVNTKWDEDMKKCIEKLKKEDPVLAEKFQKMFEKTVELRKLSDDLFNYKYNADYVIGYYDKTKASLQPFEQKVAEIVKKFEAGVLEVIKKSKKM